MGHPESSGSTWKHLGGIWNHFPTSGGHLGCIWGREEACGSIQRHAEASGSTWRPPEASAPVNCS